MKKSLTTICMVLVVMSVAGVANAAFTAGPDILSSAPTAVLDGGVTNVHQQGFNEQQGVTLLADLAVNGGIIHEGTVVDSQMIFLNVPEGLVVDRNQTWMFDGVILGVMSDFNGDLEYGSDTILGASGTTYPSGPFAARGFEDGTADWYKIDGNKLYVTMEVTQPGDWIRVVTSAAAPIPAPGAILLGSIGIGLVGWLRRRRIL